MTTPERLAQLIGDQTLVSERQRDAIRSNGNFFLLSRPGSGKTRTVGIRLARLAAEATPIRVAATSYTNVAIKQIEETVRAWGVVLGPQHFTGTIHEFLLRFVLYPFGHLRPVALKQPFHLIGDSLWSGWPAVIYRKDRRKRLSLGAFHYAVTGAFKVYENPRRLGLTREEVETEEVTQTRQRKKEVRERGLVSLSDAMFYAQKLLERHPMICAAVAERFQELILDEAQDTSDVQMRCLELLHGTGKLRSLVLVGDVDQSIYGFQGARPDLCPSLAAKCGLDRLPLTQNFRSSQAICNVTCRFCRRSEPDEAVGQNRDAAIEPEVLIYEAANPGSAVRYFRMRLAEHGIDAARAVVLARRRRFRDEINGRARVEGLNRLVVALGRLVASNREERTIDSHELQMAERLIADMALGTQAVPLDEDGRVALRRAVTRLLSALPDFDRSLADWIVGTRNEVKVALEALTDAPVHKPEYLLKAKREFRSIKARDVFASSITSLLARTVHDAKGESHEAVLLVVQPRRSGQADQAEVWAAPLIGVEVDDGDAEELRIAYVALTRAERYCAVAIPNNVDAALVAAYRGVGFVQPG